MNPKVVTDLVCERPEVLSNPQSQLFSSVLFSNICNDGQAPDLCCLIQCRVALTQPPRSATDEEKDYQDMICLGRKGGHFSQGEKGPEPLSPGAFIRFIRIGIRIKLVNHCQPVRVKQYMIYREL